MRVLDSLVGQVHAGKAPSYLNPAVELVRGDVRDPDAMSGALGGAEVVVHFAAAVGVGQSMYEVREYCSANVIGTANLLEILVKQHLRPCRILVASSMSIYGEGLYKCANCGPVSPSTRPRQQLSRHEWAVACETCGCPVEPRATPETKPLRPESVYAINKRDQEELVLCVARGIGIPAVALRFFNVYGTRQALSNPYTGVAAIFSSALLNGRTPRVFEDGHQVRDFVHVQDIVQACMLAIEREDVGDEVFNVGTGRPTDLLQLLRMLQAEIPGAERIEPEILGRFREGDVRSCYADISRAETRLGYRPRVPLELGVRELAAWVKTQSSNDGSDTALEELRRYRLVQ